MPTVIVQVPDQLERRFVWPLKFDVPRFYLGNPARAQTPTTVEDLILINDDRVTDAPQLFNAGD